MMTAAGDLGVDLPDMTSYGEGKPGVWLIATLGGDYHTGRTFFLKHLPDITRIVEQRSVRATMPVGLREYLGDAYERLKTGAVPAHQVSDDAPRNDDMDELERELTRDMDADLLDQMEAVTAKVRRTRQEQDDLDAQEITQFGPEHAEALSRARDERWRQAVATIDIPADKAGLILDLAREGVAMRDLMARLNLPKTTVWEYMAKLRVEGLVTPVGKGRAVRWHLAGDDAQTAQS